MPKLPISLTVITLNEERNLDRCLKSASVLVSEMIVVDSGSKDRTEEIARSYGAKFIYNAWPGFGAQKNFAHAQSAQPWVLNLDADEALTPEFINEIQDFFLAQDFALFSGASMPRLSWYLGRYIRHGGWYPNRLVRLAKKEQSKWTEPHVHEALHIDGRIKEFREPILHFPFSCVDDQIHTNLKFSRLGYQTLLSRGVRFSVVTLILKTLGKFIETYLWKRGFLDGAPGFVIAVHAAHSIFMKYSYFLEAREQEERAP